MKLVSPAKINLSLKIKGKRDDGYHEIETLIQAVNLFDTLEVDLADKDSFRCEFLGDDNLVTRARDLFRKKTGLNFSVSIILNKKIPMQAGLGGGSSNAATTLFALNELCKRPATIADLQLWSADLGSDVPFFFSLGSAICRGRGEIIEERPFIEKKYWIVKPKSSLSTSDVFKAYKKGEGGNDLQVPAFELMPSLRMLKNSLEKQGFIGVQMSGSGTAFFCEGDKEPDIAHATSYSVKTIFRSKDLWYS